MEASLHKSRSREFASLEPQLCSSSPLSSKEFESLLASLKREAGLAPGLLGDLSDDASPLSFEDEVAGFVKAEKVQKPEAKNWKAKGKARQAKPSVEDDEFHDCVSDDGHDHPGGVVAH